MRVLHLNTSDVSGGAARGAYWLHQALTRRTDSYMLVQRKTVQDDRVLVYGPAWLGGVARRLDRWPLRTYPEARGGFSTAFMPRAVARRVNALQPDIVNLHWINEGFMTPENVRDIRAPVVWTLRDVWPMTGGCHYTWGCEGFTERCGRCPILGSTREHDLSRQLWERKERAWNKRSITFVALSEWIAAEARRSSLLARHEVQVIPNALDTERFRPQGRAEACAALGLPYGRRYLLFSALNPLEDRRKGFAELRAALEILARRPDAGQLELLLAGPLYGELPKMPIATRSLGLVTDDQVMAQLYAAAEVTAMPSLEEAFGKVAMESLACGTPVVCLASTGTAEIVHHLQHGYHARPRDVADLAAGMEFVLDHPEPGRLARQARRHVLDTYTFEQQASAYLRVYESLLEREAQATPRSSPLPVTGSIGKSDLSSGRASE